MRRKILRSEFGSRIRLRSAAGFSPSIVDRNTGAEVPPGGAFVRRRSVIVSRLFVGTSKVLVLITTVHRELLTISQRATSSRPYVNPLSGYRALGSRTSSGDFFSYKFFLRNFLRSNYQTIVLSRPVCRSEASPCCSHKYHQMSC